MERPLDYGNPGRVTTDVDIVRAIYEAFARRDVDAALAHVADDCELVAEGTMQLLERQEPYRGHDGVREYFADVERVWQEISLHADDLRAVHGSVVVFGHVVARRHGERITRRAVWTWRLRDGKAVAVRVSDIGQA